mgnify:CR=1 FL=1
MEAHDDEADLDLAIEIELTASGLVRTRATLTNRGADGYGVDSLLLALPTPPSETLVLDQSGHHLRERETSTHEFTLGSHERTTRTARAHAGSSIHGSCEPGTGWNRGLVHYVHVAWSGNTRTLAERTVLGQQALFGGELLMRGGRRVDDQRAHVADVGDVAVQCQCVDERLARRDAAGQLEGQHATGALGRQGLCPLVPRRRREAGVVDAQHAVGGLEELGDALGGRVLTALFSAAPLSPELRQFMEDCLGYPMIDSYACDTSTARFRPALAAE